MAGSVNDPLSDIERGWRAVRDVETKHALFHRAPSIATAQALTNSVAAWRKATGAVTPPPLDEHVASLIAAARERATTDSPTHQLLRDLADVVMAEADR